MEITEKIKNLNKEVEPYYLLITMLIFFLFGFIAIAKLIFSSPDLLVTVEKENINYPSSINKNYSELFSYITDSTSNEELHSNALNVNRYLNLTKHQWVLEIKNNSSVKVKSINVRLSNVSTLTSWGVASSYLLEEERRRLMNNITFQEESGIVYLKDALDLPPNADLKLYLWGEFNNYDWVESIIVDHENGSAEIEYPERFYGYKAVVANFFFEIVLFLVITFSLTYYLMIDKYVTSQKKHSDNN